MNNLETLSQKSEQAYGIEKQLSQKTFKINGQDRQIKSLYRQNHNLRQELQQKSLKQNELKKNMLL